MSKPVIAIDVDDVIADTTEHWRLEVNRRANLDLQPEHWHAPGEYAGYYERLWQKYGVDHLITIDDIDAFMLADQSTVPAVREATEALDALSVRYNLIVVTARNPNQKEATLRWLSSVFPGIFQDIFFTNTDNSKKTKGEICVEVGASWLIDDYPGHCQDALANGVGAILYGSYGWHTTVPEGVVLCKTWTDILEVLK